MTNKSYLLPSGFYDLLFDEAEKNHKNINNLIELFLQAKYRLIKTPLVEFKEVFLNKQNDESFKTIDVESKKDLIFRSDITPQIARLLSTRLQEFADKKLKLCYVGDVLRLKNSEMGADRQLTQVGIEIINTETLEDEFEVVGLILKGLQNVVDKELTINFSLPYFLNILAQELKISDVELLQEIVANKNISLLKKNFSEYFSLLSLLVLRNENLVEIENEIKKFIKIDGTKEVVQELQLLRKFVDFVEEKFPKIKVTFDLFGDEFSYHQKINFDIFAGGFSYPVAKGGGYKINEKSAFGSTIYINNLRRI